MREPEAPAASSWMDEEEEDRRSLSPVRAFVLLLLVVAFLVGIGLIAMSNKDPVPSDQAIPNTKNFALTDQQAIAKFQYLRDLGLRATQQEDQSLVASAFVPGSPLANRSIRIIQELDRDDVIDKIRYETLGVEVASNEPTIVRIREVRKLFPCFVTPKGRDVTQHPNVVHQEVMWGMRLIGSQWRLETADLLTDKRLSAIAACP